MNDDKRVRRSIATYGKNDHNGFIHRSWMKSQGFPEHVFDGRPVIGISQTYSEFNPCHGMFNRIAEAVKRGVWEAGGFPLEFPSMSLGESQIRPTAMLYRNLMSMEVEESIRGYAMDGVVLLGGCDKNTPAQLMGAASVDLPTIVISAGPMLNGKFDGRDIGSGTDVWRLSEARRAGELSNAAFRSAEAGMSRSPGTCNTMGTASTMACLVEAMGLSLPYNGTIPSVDAGRIAMAHMSGIRIVEMVHSDTRLSHILDQTALINAIRVCAAIGGSTNAVLHLLAIAGRLGIPLVLDDWQREGRDIPLLVNLMPSGRYLMEDFHYAGGVPALLHELGDFVERSHIGVTGKSLGAIADDSCNVNPDVIHTRVAPLRENAGLVVLYGNLAPNGAIIKPSAASAELLNHRGRAIVFESIEDMHARIDDPDLPVEPSSILILKNCGPRGYPGMPEVGNMPLPKKILDLGIRDMVRISDARMSGTAFGAVVLHVAPEAAIGGPLALVRDGDLIHLNVDAASLTLEVDDAELERRRGEWEPLPRKYHRGWSGLYVDHVDQAHLGADLDFLRGHSGAVVDRDSH